ncbi:hypothetical protein ACFC08_35585 [Streptomyces sp. NPDC056112]|uniref:hypothetical protein n=1 Tax=Streptomyces sp. NPDC056112 TaxID=3345715 RepID=UPI0035DA283C
MTRRRPSFLPRSEYRSALTYHARYLLAEPLDWAHWTAGRIACRVFRRHNSTCRGRRDHPRTGR